MLINVFERFLYSKKSLGSNFTDFRYKIIIDKLPYQKDAVQHIFSGISVLTASKSLDRILKISEYL
jgi:hypothetical protein